MNVPLSEYDRRLAQQLDATMRKAILLLLQQGLRPTPATINGLRDLVVEGFFEASRLAVQNDNARRRQRADVVPGPWDDEITSPERPSNRPKPP